VHDHIGSAVHRGERCRDAARNLRVWRDFDDGESLGSQAVYESPLVIGTAIAKRLEAGGLPNGLR
jgi:hypothetical protein